MNPPSVPTTEAKTSSQALWSLILGILSITCLWLLGSIPAIILGILAIKNIDRSGGILKGRGMGIAGIVTGSVGILAGLGTVGILAGLALPAYKAFGEQAKLTRVTIELRQVSLACSLYASDHGGTYPESLTALAEEGYLETEAINPALSPDRPFLYRKGMTGSSVAGEIFLASPLPINGRRAIGGIGGGVEAVPEVDFQADYAHLFPRN